MHTITIVLVMLLAVTVSGLLARATRLPLPLVQIALGFALVQVTGESVELDPHLFFLLFLPPLLFLDGWRIPKDELFRDKGMVLELALGLVVMTVLGVGLFIHWLIPAMPYAVSFALAAILSPTDPIAVSAIAQRVPIPKRMMHILEGESLLNDASGLVCMRFAVAAALTGAFSLADALVSFSWVALGGLGIGVAVAWVVTRVKSFAVRRFGEDPGSSILISVLIPFASYLAAEHFHASGILAAVAAGISMTFFESGTLMATTRVQRRAFWDTVQFILNGTIFVLLGEQLPALLDRSINTVADTGHDNPWWLLVYVLVINAALASMRFAWVWVSLRITVYRARRRGEAHPPVAWRAVAAMSLAGVRGALTLAGVMTLPLAMNDGSPFPARDLAIFLAAGVILMSLLAASFALPQVLRGLELPEDDHDHLEGEARVAAAVAAIRAIEDKLHELASERTDASLYADIAARVMEDYRRRVHATPGQSGPRQARHAREIERKLRLVGLEAERSTYRQLRRNAAIDDTVLQKLDGELDLVAARLSV
ncbi:MAG TPA: Na+/H+ antiporter [Dokdonella sp.]|uniref:Na+/H+ antiporter n=1 Tax=Dokdonella sp. TaxID=2291710 RepID=UPI0025B7D2E3|nr:Na+/H+ antiporter [Dokdonella sp.]MBX3690995.1 Na+/H+ antiporter [Dokdonella sp.]MCW5567826.1 Na+/H+ antiporter [Dokdonella sp.]HNR91266.1 Na+/H+ antiporter [Dokdonella sp.]